MFVNLAQWVVLQAQTKFSDIQLEFGDSDGSQLSIRAHKFNDYGGYAFLPHCKEEYLSPLEDDKHDALKIYWCAQRWPDADTWPNAVCCWAKLQLPNGQKAHLVWQEQSVATKPCWLKHLNWHYGAMQNGNDFTPGTMVLSTKHVMTQVEGV